MVPENVGDLHTDTLYGPCRMTFMLTRHFSPEHPPTMVEEHLAGRLLSGERDEASQAKGGVCFIAKGQEVPARGRRRIDVGRQAVPQVPLVGPKIPEPRRKIGAERLT